MPSRSAPASGRWLKSAYARSRSSSSSELPREEPPIGSQSALDGDQAGHVIRVRGLEKHFRSLTVLTDVDLDVESGEAVALLGENGAGKSTLLRILGTAIIPDAGEVFVGGHDVVASPARARAAMGFLLSDERSWYWRLTGRHNLEFFAALHGLSPRLAALRTDDLLSLVGLEEAAGRPFGEYSSGMRLRLSLARALISEPQVLLLDEPTRSIDPIARRHFHDLVKDMIRGEGGAVLLATHDLHEAAELATRCAFLAHGRLMGTTDTWRDVDDLEAQLLAAAQ